MFGIANSVLGLLGIVLLGGAILGLNHYFSADAKQARRRARSHGSVVSRKRGPTVKLAVDVNKQKDRRDR